MRLIATVAATILATGFALAAPVAAHAAGSGRVGGVAAATPSLTGTWNSASLRMDGIGYSLAVTPFEAGSARPHAYQGVVRFHFQDGRLGKRISVQLTQHGSKITMAMPGKPAVSGTLGQDGSITFAGCQAQLKWATKSNADSMCLFQELPVA
jgi:hypothetical protein